MSWHVPVWYVLVCTCMYGYALVYLILFFEAGFRGSHRDAARQATAPDHASREEGDSSPCADGRRGSNVYEVNTWLWMFGRGKPRLGGLSVEETALRKGAARVEQVKLAVETRRRRRAAKAASK